MQVRRPRAWQRSAARVRHLSLTMLRLTRIAWNLTIMLSLRRIMSRVESARTMGRTAKRSRTARARTMATRQSERTAGSTRTRRSITARARTMTTRSTMVAWHMQTPLRTSIITLTSRMRPIPMKARMITLMRHIESERITGSTRTRRSITAMSRTMTTRSTMLAWHMQTPLRTSIVTLTSRVRPIPMKATMIKLIRRMEITSNMRPMGVVGATLARFHLWPRMS
mmetsp:Transcript_24992/g.63134  ORF Transcript_24992/g.63134 Transcript_24992/m.63134 type:complete len:225 (-) Transcript_24992:759-1433(-)